MKWTGKHSYLGIAFGERSISVAEIAPSSRESIGPGGKAWEVRRAAEFVPPATDGTPADVDSTTADAFVKFLREFGFGASRAVIGVPARWVVAREREMPPSTDEQAAGILRMQAERSFSAELGELVVDYAGAADPSGPRGVLLVALPKRQLERVVKLVEAAGREVEAVMPSTLALSDAVASEADSAGRAGDGLILNLGGEAVELSARRGGSPKLLRHLAVRGNDFASANGARDAAVSSLAGEIRRTVALMPGGVGASGAAPKSPEALHLWDGVGLDAKDATTLARQAGVDLRGGATGNGASLAALGLSAAATRDASGAMSRFAPALALAVAGARPRVGAVDFLHPRLAPPKKRHVGRRGAWTIGIAAVALLSLLGLWGWVVYMESQIARAKVQIETLRPDKEKAEKVRARINTARGWYPEGRPPVLDCARDIVNAFPDGGEAIYVTKFNFAPETRRGSFIGKSPNQDLVLDLVQRLHANKNFSNLKNDYILDAGGTSRDVAFSITFMYQGTPPVPSPTTKPAGR